MNIALDSKIRVVIDLQGFQRIGNRKRGIGRYSLELIRSLINNYPQNEYVLFANASLYNFSDYFSEELNSKRFNVSYFEWSPVGEINEDLISCYSKNSISIQIRSYALSLIHADLILLTSFFDGFKDNTLIDFDDSYNLPPIVAIIYDLIPLIQSSDYLDIDEEYKYFYLGKIQYLNKIDALLTISESSKKEILKYTDFDPEKVFNISAACDNHLFQKNKISCSESPFNTKDFGDFLLYVGAIDPRKNLYRLLKAYSLLPIHILIKHKLLLTGPYSKTEIALINSWIIELNLSVKNVIILGFVSDHDLVNLYQNCYLFVFPSIHEGFGLPVLEAISCGAPVIASNSTSIPEILNFRSSMFDPYSIDQIKDLIIKASTNRDFYTQLKVNSKSRSAKFSWEFTASKTIKSINKIIQYTSSKVKRDTQKYTLYDSNEKYYTKLISNLKNNKLIKCKRISNQRYLQRVSSAIDLLNTQAKRLFFGNSFSNSNSIWRIEGPFDSSYSLAILNKNFALALSRLGQDVVLYSTEGPGDFIPNPAFLNENPLVKKLYEKSYTCHSQNTITSRNLYPPRASDLNSNINLFHAYGWEESLFPQDWANDFNNYLDGITVMSSHVKKILIDSGVYLPIKVCGLGVDHVDNVTSDSNYKFKKKSFSFLHISSCFPRKGIDILLKAYGDSFTSFDDVSLIIKTFKNPHNDVYNLLMKFQAENIYYPDVLIIDNNLNDLEIQSIYKQCDVLVCPSFGEGFNLTLAEAMKLGIPTITTGWGGQMDFCDASNSWLIDYQLEYTDTHFKLFGSVWARPSVSHLSHIMKEIYQLPTSNILSKVRLAKQTIEDYQWNKVAIENVDFISFISSFNKNIRLKIGWISTWDTRCGIATYSEHLLSCMSDDYIIFAQKSNKETKANVIRCWNIGDDELEELFQKIVNNHITTIVVQFNYGFFDFLAFSKFIMRIKKHKIKIIVFLHSTIDPQSNTTKKIKDLLVALTVCNRVFVHSPSDLNRLKNIGLVDNVTLFPHGIISSDKYILNRDLRQKRNQEILFSSYGFCLPNKGFKELIKAIYILRNNKIKCKLKLYTSLYDSEVSLHFYNQLLDLISELKLHKTVHVNPNFLSDELTLKKLSKTDLVVFPYQSTNESVSGAVRQGLSSSTNVAVTPLPIFDDVSDVVYKLPGSTPELIASGLMEWAKTCYGKPMSVNEQKWRQKHSFDKLANRLSRIIKSIQLND